MATGGEEQVPYSLVKERSITLKNSDENLNTNKKDDYISIVICQNKIIVVDYEGEADVNDDKNKVKIYRLHDGEFLDMLDTSSRPRAICLMDATTICVLHHDGLIQMASIKYEDMSPVFKINQSFHLRDVFDYCTSVLRVNNNIAVVGEIDKMMYWCIVSLEDEQVGIPQICEPERDKSTTLRNNRRYVMRWNYLAIKNNIIYYLWYSIFKIEHTGVYAFNILDSSLDPSQSLYRYKHKLLEYPASIVINEDGNIFVGNDFNYNIHQLTSSLQLVAIFFVGWPFSLRAMFWDNGRLYVTHMGSRAITVLRHVHQEVPVNDERTLFDTEESAIQISQGNVDNGESSVETETLPSASSPEDSADETQGKHTDSGVTISDEGKQQVIEGTSIQIGHEIM